MKKNKTFKALINEREKWVNKSIEELSELFENTVRAVEPEWDDLDPCEKENVVISINESLKLDHDVIFNLWDKEETSQVKNVLSAIAHILIANGLALEIKPVEETPLHKEMEECGTETMTWDEVTSMTRSECANFICENDWDDEIDVEECSGTELRNFIWSKLNNEKQVEKETTTEKNDDEVEVKVHVSKNDTVQSVTDMLRKEFDELTNGDEKLKDFIRSLFK